jgi:hypothetical protein
MSVPARRRIKLVEGRGVEVFEVRVTLWFDDNGRPWTSLDITDPDGPTTPMLHEVLGVLDMAREIARAEYG